MNRSKKQLKELKKIIIGFVEIKVKDPSIIADIINDDASRVESVGGKVSLQSINRILNHGGKIVKRG